MDCTASVTPIASALRLCGFDEHDFEVDSNAGPLSQFGLDEALVTVRRRSTGDERLYSARNVALLLFGVIADATQGHFGPPTGRG